MREPYVEVCRCRIVRAIRAGQTEPFDSIVATGVLAEGAEQSLIAQVLFLSFANVLNAFEIEVLFFL